jgi:hypothetical protein
MHVRCAWCALPLGEKEPLDDNSTSHAICPDCAARLCAGEARRVRPGAMIWMTEVERLCALCARRGALALLRRLKGPEDLHALARACTARAEQLDRAGDDAAAAHLREGARSLVQYAAYRALPYILD